MTRKCVPTSFNSVLCTETVILCEEVSSFHNLYLYSCLQLLFEFDVPVTHVWGFTQAS